MKIFLEENESEGVTCIRYNKCLSLVPQSKVAFMETFKHWQPHIVLDKICDLPQPRKRLKVEGEDCEYAAVEVESIEAPHGSFDIEEPQPDNLTEEEWIRLEIVNSEVMSENSKVWDCQNCDPVLRYSSESEFRNHLQSFHLNFEEEMLEESEMFEMSDNIEAIEEQIDDTFNESQNFYQCKHCTFESAEKNEFKMHQLTHLDQKSFQSSRFEKLFCSNCCFQFTTQAHYQSHMNGHQLYEIVAKHSVYPTCTSCSVMFIDDKFLNMHLDKHDKGSEANEPLLSEGNFLKLGLHRPDLEQLDTTLATDGLKCGHCTKRFNDEELCKLHQLIFHVTTLTCPIENRIFNGNQAFSIHMRNNHPELFGDEVKFRCSVCKKQFENLYDKLKHMKTCDEKKFQCTHCDKKFSQKCYLNTHLRQISGESSISCQVCGKICLNKGDFQIHFRYELLRG